MHEIKSSVPTRRVQDRVVRNDALMLDAATNVLAHDGWSALSLSGVAREMGLSNKPVHDRVENRSHLAALLWRDRIAQELLTMSLRVVDSINDCSDEFCEAISAFLDSDELLDAAAELLIVSRFDNCVALAIEETFAAPLLRHIESGSSSQIEKAKANYALMLAIGIWLSSRFELAGTPGVKQALSLWYLAIKSADYATELPTDSATHMDDEPLLVEDDPVLDRLLNAVLVNVGKYGFEATTTMKIAKLAGVSEGYLFNRYKSKIDIFVAATELQHKAGFALNDDFFSAIENRYGIGTAEAVAIREAQLPHRDLARTMLLEQLRVGWHHGPLQARAENVHKEFREQLLKNEDHALRETPAEYFINIALSIGIAALPIIDPDSSKLPYVAITLPLYESIARR